jgi:hypothetical protein
MKQFVRRAVQECYTCQRAKPEHVRYPGLLQPLPFRKLPGRLSPWISLKAFRNLVASMVSS